MKDQNPAEPPSGSDGSPEREPDDDLTGLNADDIVIPDDARELARDVEAWRREQRYLQRRRRLERLFFTGRRRERGISGALVTLILIGVGLLGATISILTPRAARLPTTPVPLPLAAPAVAPGTAHGLVPDVTLSGADGKEQARDLRPGVLAIPSRDCDCDDALVALARQTTANAIPVFLIGNSSQAGQLDELARNTSEYDVHVLVDDSGEVAGAYQPQGLTVVPVHADGVTDTILRGYDGKTALGPVLADLKQAGPA